jgi:hypothetical protein
LLQIKDFFLNVNAQTGRERPPESECHLRAFRLSLLAFLASILSQLSWLGFPKKNEAAAGGSQS